MTGQVRLHRLWAQTRNAYIDTQKVSVQLVLLVHVSASPASIGFMWTDKWEKGLVHPLRMSVHNKFQVLNRKVFCLKLPWHATKKPNDRLPKLTNIRLRFTDSADATLWPPPLWPLSCSRQANTHPLCSKRFGDRMSFRSVPYWMGKRRCRDKML